MNSLIIIVSVLLVFGITIAVLFKTVFKKSREYFPLPKSVSSITTHNIHLYTSPLTNNIITTQLLSSWINELTAFWFNHYTLELQLEAIKGAKIYLLDANSFFLTYQGQKREVVGATRQETKQIIITTLPNSLNRIKSLVFHELSHLVVFSATHTWDEAEHHSFFVKVGLEG